LSYVFLESAELTLETATANPLAIVTKLTLNKVSDQKNGQPMPTA